MMVIRGRNQESNAHLCSGLVAVAFFGLATVAIDAGRVSSSTAGRRQWQTPHLSQGRLHSTEADQLLSWRPTPSQVADNDSAKVNLASTIDIGNWNNPLVDLRLSLFFDLRIL